MYPLLAEALKTGSTLGQRNMPATVATFVKLAAKLRPCQLRVLDTHRLHACKKIIS